MSRLLFLILQCLLFFNCVRALDLRLPHHIKPKSYDIQINPQYEETNNLSGVVQIEVECIMEGSKNITLHAKLINITHMNIIEKVSQNDIEIMKSSKGENGTDFVIIHLLNNLQNGSVYILTMNYTTIVDKTIDPYVNFVGGNQSTKGFLFDNGVYYTRLLPIFARTVFPCFDEPSFKSVFNITLRRPINMTSISNMPIKRTIIPKNSEDIVYDIFDSTPLMSTYLVAFAITNYTNEIIPSNNTVELRIWSSEEDKSKTCRAKQVTPTLYKYLNGYFGINLPIPKQDMIPIPKLYPAAWENWGLITFQSRLLLIEENVTSIRSLFLNDIILILISHELTHQWMGNLVTPSWWDELWLKEGTSLYISYFVLSSFFPNEGSLDRFMIFVFQKAMKKDCTIFSKPIKREITTNEQIFNMFDYITYKKSASIIRMISGIIGEDKLQKAFKNIMQKYGLKNINKDLFWKEIDGVVSCKKHLFPKKMKLEVLMESWFNQEGYPVINVSPNFKNGSIQISQNIFVADSSSKETNDNVWWVPLKYNIINKRRKRITKLIWLNDTKLNQVYRDVDLMNRSHCLYPVIFNINQTGYYRINYNDENWKRITQYLRFNYTKIYKYNRVQLVDDSFSLAMKGFLSYLVPFKITTYLPNEDQPLIWITFFEKLSDITSKIFRIELHDNIKVYLRNITQKLFDKYQKEYLESRDALHKKLWQLSTQWSCKMDNPKCINISIKAVEEWMKNNTKVPNEEIFEALVCTAIRNGNESVWNFVASQYSSIINPNNIVTGLACSTNKSIIEKYLDMTRENQTFHSKANIVFEKVCETQNGRSSFFNFIKMYYDEMEESKDMEESLYKVLKLSNNNTCFDEVADFIKEKIEFSESEIEEIRKQWNQNQADIRIVNDWIQTKKTII